MRKKIKFPILLLSVFVIGLIHFSNPGDYEVAKIQQQAYTSLEVLYQNPEQQSLPQKFIGTVRSSMAIPMLGYCILEQGGKRLLVFTRGFCPPSNAKIHCVVRPRRLAQFGEDYILIGAMVDFKIATPTKPQKESEPKEPLFSS